MITIYHNPRCGKSRECLAFIENSKQEFEVIKYLENPLTFKELESIIKKLNLKPIELIRTKESIWIENFKGKALSDKEIIQSMVDFPILMERPIAVNGNKAVIARPFEKVKEII
ncbi:arsenate reductase (glutaredoxin) [Flavobacterium chungnamense]|uniref:Arsenate reductase (Glutaredoxin) n=1 Tax=Flavobacterium chungnamense TaxID=706182 RepID=A0ABP7UZR2_9FLAO